MLRWRIRTAHGRYIQLPPGDPGTILMVTRQDLATVFEGTRDYVDGICYGLTVSLAEKYEPESLIHLQKPVYE